MLKLKKVTRITTTALLIVLVSLPIAAFHIPMVSAFEHTQIHPFMTKAAGELLPEGPMRHDIYNSEIYTIMAGSTDEDNNDHIYVKRYTKNTVGIRCIPHYWDADAGPDDPVSPGEYVYILPGIPTEFPNAYEKACALFGEAFTSWSPDPMSSERVRAYEYLGHVAHLIEDQAVPAHTHEDMHVSFGDLNLPGGDDCYEHWLLENSGEIWTHYGGGSAGLIEFPREIKEKMRNEGMGVGWYDGLYYLMYTTNQRADYFASDDCDGDTNDPEGWMGGFRNFPDRPTLASQLTDNDHGPLGDTLQDRDIDDENGDLSKILANTFVYAIRAVATLYKMFYEMTHRPTGSITIVDDGDDVADSRFAKLDLTYDIGASDFFRDLEVSFSNDGAAWTTWEPAGPVPVGCRKSWILPGDDGPKTVFYKLKNSMAKESEVYSDSIRLEQTALSQEFDYRYNATGKNDISATVHFRIWFIHVKCAMDNPATEETPGVEFLYNAVVDDGYDNFLTDVKTVKVYEGLGDSIEPDYDYYAGMDPYFGYGTIRHDWIGWDEIFTLYDVQPGQTVRLRTSGYDWDGDSNQNMGSVYTPTYTIGFHGQQIQLENSWIEGKGQGEVTSDYYAMWFYIYVDFSWVDWSGYEPPQTEAPYHFGVDYGKPIDYIDSSNLLADAETKWYVAISNPAVYGEMRGFQLWACTRRLTPDIIVATLGSVNLVITDPDGLKTGVMWTWVSLYYPGIGFVPTLMRLGFSEIPGAYVKLTDLDKDGNQDALIVIDERKVGDYQVEMPPNPPAPTRTQSLLSPTTTTLTDTYSIAVSSPALTGKYAFLSRDTPVAEAPTQPLLMRSAPAELNLPPRANAGGSYSATEGAFIDFDAGGSTDPDGDSLTYRWDFENDGAWDTEWSNSSTVSHMWLDDWIGTTRVEVNDAQSTNTATATVTVFNVAPTINAGPDRLASPIDEIHFNGSFTDAGVTDTQTIVWNFDDGTTATGTLTPTHIFSEARKHEVILSVTDDNGGVGTDELIVNTGVEVSTDPISIWVAPGESTIYNVLIHHLGKTSDTYSVALYGLDASWYSLSATSVTTRPDQTISITLEVSPPDPAPFASFGFTIVASSQADPAVNDAADAYAMVATAHDLGLEEIPPVTNIAIGEPKYTDSANKIYVTSATSFTLTAEDNLDGTGVASTFYYIFNATHDTGRLRYTAPFYLTGLSDGQYSIVYYSKDNVANKEVAKSEQVTLDDAPPTITMVIAPVSINTPVTLTATVDDSRTGGCRIVSAEYSVDGGTWMPMNALDGKFDEATEEVAATLNPSPTPDVFAISVRGADALGNQNQLLTLLAVYDPAAGFVTGAGWINSPSGAYSADPTLTGRATFGFVSRYQKGANTPTGHTEFQFHAGDLHFQSSTYEWLVVAGARAQFKGSGTINGAGNYGFMLTAIDGQINGGGGIDKFRIKIWDKATGIIIYDNQMDIADTDNPTTTIAAGNIVIHT